MMKLEIVPARDREAGYGPAASPAGLSGVSFKGPAGNWPEDPR